MRAGISIVMAAAALLASPLAAAGPQAPQRIPGEIRLHPAALAQLIDELGGRAIVLPKARVIALINPRAFLVESASALPAARGNLDRVLVLVERGEMRVDPAMVVGSTVTVAGVARTLLGMQVSREVAWPRELTREIVDRYEIRAVVLASSVQAPDGVDLVTAR